MSGSPGGSPDDLDRELAELVADPDRPAKFREPSAAERAQQAERTRRAERARQAQRARQAKRAQRAGWRRDRRLVRYAAGVAGFLIIGAVAYYLFPIFGNNGGRGAGIIPVTPSRLPSPTAAAPFLGTPAQHYADGAAGIIVPAAQPVGSYSAAQVTASYQTTKQMLAAADLDRQTLAGGSPDAFASLLIPEERTAFTQGLDKTGRDAQGSENSTRTWVTSFASGTQLVGHVVKVHGTMTATTATNNTTPVLRIHADYLFVYPVQKNGQPGTLMRIVNRVVVNVDFGVYAGSGTALEPWWDPVGGGAAGARCDTTDGYVHPEFPGGPPDAVAPNGVPHNPYDQSEPVTTSGKCTATTGT